MKTTTASTFSSRGYAHAGRVAEPDAAHFWQFNTIARKVDLRRSKRAKPSPAARRNRRDLLGGPLAASLLMTGAWRLLVAVVGIWAHFSLQKGGNYRSLLHHGWSINLFTLITDASVRLDAYWYGSIALHGYRYSPYHVSSIGYYPLYPMVIKVVSLGVDNVYVAGALVSTGCLFLAVYLFYTWMRHRGLENDAPAATALLLLFPFSFFYTAMMTESLFLALVLAAFNTAERGRWWWSSLAVFLAVLTRPTGIVLVPAIALLAWKDRGGGRSRWLAPAAGVGSNIAFTIYQWVAFGTPFAYERTHAAPPNNMTIHQAISDVLLQARHGFPSWYLGFMLFWGVLFLAFVPVVHRRFGMAYALYATLSVLIPLVTTLPGLERYVIVIFPVFAAVATVPHPRLKFALLCVSFWLGMAFTGFFVQGYGLF
jgi:DIE2/ALG10 family